MNNLQSKIESLLFVSNKPLTANAIAKLVNAKAEEVTASLNEIAEQRKESGMVLLEAGGAWQLATNPQNSEEVKNFMNAELREKLTDATIETLAIIAYRQPISKAEIEAIRGVNCQYSVRHLLIRGLIQKIPNPRDSRQPLYETTLEFLQHMGLKNVNELPEFESLIEKIKLPEAPNLEDALAGEHQDEAHSVNEEI
jgi:segregation and condensation protein B